MNGIEYFGNNALVNVDDVAFTFETSTTPREFAQHRIADENLDWTEQQYTIGDYRVFPYGSGNDLPKVVKDVVQNDSLAPGMLKKKYQLLWGQGPQLYRETWENRIKIKDWQDDKQVMEWLQSWDFEDYLLKSVVDCTNIEGSFTKFYLAKGARVYRPSIAKLEHTNPDKCRLAIPASMPLNHRPTHAIVTDWGFNSPASLTDWKSYALFDYNNPFQHRNSILYSNMYSFASDYYTVPDIYGSLEWIRRSTAIPLILKYLSKNSINLKYHVISPAAFWEKKQAELEKKCKEKNKEYDDKMLIKYKNDFLRQIAKVLSGDQNTGKFWHSVKYVEIDGHKLLEHGWEIKEIKQNIKDFVDAQVKIAEQAGRAVATSLSVHPSLSSAGESGRADSGAEQLYAFKNYLATGVDIPEMIVTKAINYALKINFPKKELKLGFYRTPDAVKREEDTTPEERLKNVI